MNNKLNLPPLSKLSVMQTFPSPSVHEPEEVNASENFDYNKGKNTTGIKIEEALNKTRKIDKKKNGRWTKEECKLFEEALEKYGKHWKKVEAYVGTRSGTQIRSHAQKYFLKSPGKNSVVPNDCEVNSSITPTTLNQNPKEEENINKNENSLISESNVIDRTQNKIEFNNINSLEQNSNINKLDHGMYIGCRYLQEYMKQFGFNNLYEIYCDYRKLSDWVNTTTL